MTDAKQIPNAAARIEAVTSDGKVIAKLIKSIAQRNTRLREDVALAAACVVVHATVHGDVTLATRLVDALGEGWRTNALKQWFIDFGPFMWVKDKGADGKVTFEGFKLNVETRAEYVKAYEGNPIAFGSKLMAEPFWVYKPEPEFKPFNLKAELAKLITRAKNVQKGDNAANPANNFDGLDKVVEFAAQL